MMPHRFTTPLLLLLLLTACTDSREQQLQLEELERQNRADSVMQDLALAQSLADHFDRHGTRNEQLRAHYILGRTHADRGELPQAVAAYNDAAERANTTAKDCDYRTLNRLLPTLLLQEKKLPNIGFVLSSVGAVLLSIGAVLSSVDAVSTLVAAKEHF